MWTEEDQDKALAFLAFESSRCPSCGTVPEDWIDDEKKRKFLEDAPYVLESRMCYGCRELEDEWNSIPEVRKKGMRVYLRPKRRSDALRTADRTLSQSGPDGQGVQPG